MHNCHCLCSSSCLSRMRKNHTHNQLYNKHRDMRPAKPTVISTRFEYIAFKSSDQFARSLAVCASFKATATGCLYVLDRAYLHLCRWMSESQFDFRMPAMLLIPDVSHQSQTHTHTLTRSAPLGPRIDEAETALQFGGQAARFLAHRLQGEHIVARHLADFLRVRLQQHTLNVAATKSEQNKKYRKSHI